MGPHDPLKIRKMNLFLLDPLHLAPTPRQGAKKFYFMHYSRVVIILLSKGLYKFAFSIYSLVKLGFRLSVFWFFVFLWLLVLNFSVLCIEFNVIS